MIPAALNPAASGGPPEPALLQQQHSRVELPEDPPEHLRVWQNVDRPDDDLDRFARVLAQSVWAAARREVERQQGTTPPASGEMERQQHRQPVPVSERLPGPEDCDDEGQVWHWDERSDAWVLYSANGIEIRHTQGLVDYWLPAHALPVPASGEAEP